MRLLAAILALVLLAVAPAHAEKRIALVIGNKDYKAGVGALANPLNDIRIVGTALKSVGFDVLTPVENASRQQMLSAVYEFASALKEAGPDAVGFIYYSGHGVASEEENYLIPVDVTEPTSLQLRVQGVRQSEVLEILRRVAPNAAHYLVLDACRNTLQGSRGGKGFVPVEQQNGVLIAFSTEPGKTAQDTGASSGPYAAALAAELVKPGQIDLLMFHNIRVDVMDKTNRDQVPWFEDGIQRRERPMFALATSAPPAGLDPQNALLLDTKYGRVVIKLRPDLAPKHAERLKLLTREKFYDNVPFHRVIAGFMAQTGDGQRGDGTGGSKYPNLPAEFSSVPFVRGVVGMARTKDNNSANSQFFIMTAANPSLNGLYTVIGEVVSGMEAVDEIKKGEPAIDPDRIIRMQVAADVNDLVLENGPKAVQAERRRVATASSPVTPTGPCSSQVTNVSLSSRAAKPLSAAEECALNPKDVFEECEKCPEMVVVSAGRFTMGSPSDEKGRETDEGPQHAVTISRALAVGKFTVTVDQFADFVKETDYDTGSKCGTIENGKGEERPDRSFRNPGFSQTGSHPAVCVNWNDAKAYVAWLSKKTGKPYRLLTESEWEYAARARSEPGSYPRYFFGDNEDDMCRYGNGDDQTAKIAGAGDGSFNCTDGYAYTAPAGSFLPNAFGLYDMHGNAWQWVEDCRHDNYQGAPTDGSAWASGDCDLRVLRGGSWQDIPWALRTAARVVNTTDFRNFSVGFRVARTLTQ